MKACRLEIDEEVADQLDLASFPGFNYLKLVAIPYDTARKVVPTRYYMCRVHENVGDAYITTRVGEGTYEVTA